MVNSTQVTLEYVADARGTSIDTLSTLLASVPVPLDAVSAMGCQLLSDMTTQDVNKVTRSVVLSLAPTVPATVAGVTLDQYGGIESVTVGTEGSTYGAIPVVTIDNIPTGSPAKFSAMLTVNTVLVANGGSAYVAPTLQFVGGLVPPQIDPDTGLFPESCLQALVVSAPGLGYSANAKIQFHGALAEGGAYPTAVPTFDAHGHLVAVTMTSAGHGIIATPDCYVWDPGPTGSGVGGGTGAILNCTLGVGVPALGTATLTGDAITSVTVSRPGGPYVMPPQIVVTDTAGSGAALVAQMGIDSIDVIEPGNGYPSSVAFSITPLLFAPTADLANLFRNLMTVPLQQAVLSPITASEPVFS